MNSNNPPAFPCDFVTHEHVHKGLTMRDYFAAMVLQGLLAHHGDSGWHPEAEVQSMEGAAETAYDYADAMLSARNQQQPTNDSNDPHATNNQESPPQCLRPNERS